MSGASCLPASTCRLPPTRQRPLLRLAALGARPTRCSLANPPLPCCPPVQALQIVGCCFIPAYFAEALRSMQQVCNWLQPQLVGPFWEQDCFRQPQQHCSS